MDGIQHDKLQQTFRETVLLTDATEMVGHALLEQLEHVALVEHMIRSRRVTEPSGRKTAGFGKTC